MTIQSGLTLTLTHVIAGAFIPCRFGVMGYAVVWTVIYKEFFTSPYYEIVVYATSIVALLNAGLFCRLYRSDVLRQHKRQHKRIQGTSETHNNNDLTADDDHKDKDD
jgi:hypothetical protein